MATLMLVGGAARVAQQTTVTISTPTSGETVRLRCNGKTIASYAIQGGDTANDVVAGLIADYNTNSSYGYRERADATGTDPGGSYALFTAVTPGTPFTFTADVTGGSSTGVSVATPVASSGPSHHALADNWINTSGTHASPANNDVLILPPGAPPLLWDLEANASHNLILNAWPGYTGQIGLPPLNAAGYDEYRPRYLKARFTLVTFGARDPYQSGTLGPSLAFVESTSANACTFLVNDSGTPALPGFEAINLRGNHASNVLRVARGYVSYGAEAWGSTPLLSELRTGSLASGGDTTGNVRVSLGATVDDTLDIYHTAGVLFLRGGAALLDQTTGNGQTIWTGGDIADAKIFGGVLSRFGSGNITGTLEYGDQGVVDCSDHASGAITIADCIRYPGGVFRGEHLATFTNPPTFAGGATQTTVA